jgi:hypothetical protein
MSSTWSASCRVPRFYIEDWTPSDVLAWTALMLRYFDPEGIEARGQLDNARLFTDLMEKFPADYMAMFEDLRWINDPEALTYIPPESASGIYAAASAVPAMTTAGVADMGAAAGRIIAMRDAVDENLKEINAFVKWAATPGPYPETKPGPAIRLSTPAPRWDSPCRRSSWKAPSTPPT